MTFRLKDPQRRNPKVQALLDQGEGDAADAGRWLAGLVRSTIKDAEEDVYHRMPTWAVKDGAGFAHVSVYSKHASLGFTRGARLQDKDGLFGPSASHTYRAVKVAAPGAVPKSKLIPLLRQAAAVAREETAAQGTAGKGPAGRQAGKGRKGQTGKTARQRKEAEA